MMNLDLKLEPELPSRKPVTSHKATENLVGLIQTHESRYHEYKVCPSVGVGELANAAGQNTISQ